MSEASKAHPFTVVMQRADGTGQALPLTPDDVEHICRELDFAAEARGARAFKSNPMDAEYYEHGKALRRDVSLSTRIHAWYLSQQQG